MTGAGDAPPASAPAIVAKGAVGLFGGLIVAGIAGDFVCFLMSLMWDKGNVALAYIVWPLVGAIGGFLAMSTAGEWAAPPGPGQRSWIYRPDARRIALLLIAGGLLTIALLVLLLRQFVWGDAPDDYFMPTSMPHSIAFFIGAAIGLACSRQMAVMEEKGGS